MKINRQFLLFISLSILCLSCQPSRFSQCQQLFTVINESTKEAKSLTNESKSDDLASFKQGAEVLKKSALKIESLNLTDPVLIEAQGNFVKIYNSYSKATLQMISAQEKIDRDKANSALDTVSEMTNLEKETGESLQSYCLNEAD